MSSQELPPLRGTLPPIGQNPPLLAPYHLPGDYHPPSVHQPSAPVIIQVQKAPTILHKYRSRPSLILGIIQIVAGFLGILVGAIGLWIQIDADTNYYNYYWDPTVAYYVGPLLWCSVFFFLSGAFAICAARRKSLCMIVTHMVMASLGSICSFVALMFGISAIVQDSIRLDSGHNYNYNYNGYDDYGPDYYLGNETYIIEPYQAAPDDHVDALAKGSVAMSVFFLLIGLVEFVTSIWGASLACRVTCCNSCNTEAQVSPRVMSSIPGYGQNHVIIVDAQGRPIQGAQIQLAAMSAHVTTPAQMEAQPLPRKDNSSPPPPY